MDTSALLAPAAQPFADGWAVSVVTVGELEAGVLSAEEPSERAALLSHLAAVIGEADALPVDRSVAARYGELRAASGRRQSNDLWIAATALAHDFALITRDERQARLPLVRSTLLT